jgi:Druantia protein DruA
LRSSADAATLRIMAAILSYRHRVVSEGDVAFIRALIAAHPQASRRELSRKLCTAWHWVQANGVLRDMVCRGLMLQLHRAGWIELPPVRQVPPNPLVQRGQPVMVSVDTQPLQVSLAAIQPLEWRQVRRTPDEALFNSLLDQYHYLGYTRPVGEQLKYLVLAHGRPVACLAWSSAPRHLGSRDRFIGWCPQARLKNIRLLAYNTRFLILPWVTVEHLASHLLGRMARVLSGDWERRYGHPIYFVETFVDRARFRGTCYRAANWVRLGVTTGRGKDAPTKKPNRPVKEVLGLPLRADFRQRLCALG